MTPSRTLRYSPPQMYANSDTVQVLRQEAEGGEDRRCLHRGGVLRRSPDEGTSYREAL